jgi:hypothetical protein
MEREEWAALNKAQATIAKLSEGQKKALLTRRAVTNRTYPALRRLGVIQESVDVYRMIPTDLGQNVITVLKGREVRP